MNLPRTATHPEQDAILQTVPGMVEDIHWATEDLLRSSSAADATSGHIRMAAESRVADSFHALSSIRVHVGASLVAPARRQTHHLSGLHHRAGRAPSVAYPDGLMSAFHALSTIRVHVGASLVAPARRQTHHLSGLHHRAGRAPSVAYPDGLMSGYRLEADIARHRGPDRRVQRQRVALRWATPSPAVAAIRAAR